MANTKWNSSASPQALIFDLMGTVCDWNTVILSALSSSRVVAGLDLSKLAADWRSGFFVEIHERFESGLPAEDIDITHRRVLDRLLDERGVSISEWDEETRQRLVAQWHCQVGWKDAQPALSRLRKKFFLIVLANGTTRLQLDIAKSAELPFHALFSSELLEITKPNPAIYLKAVKLMQLKPEQCVMVASHAYDLRAAKGVGLKTVYIQRSTEDLDEDMTTIRSEVDLFIDGTMEDYTCGLGELADIFNA